MFLNVNLATAIIPGTDLQGSRPAQYRDNREQDLAGLLVLTLFNGFGSSSRRSWATPTSWCGPSPTLWMSAAAP